MNYHLKYCRYGHIRVIKFLRISDLVIFHEINNSRINICEIREFVPEKFAKIKTSQILQDLQYLIVQ